MQSGKIGGQHVPASSEPVIAAREETGANAGQRSGARNRQRTGLPPALEGLPRPSAHQAQARPASSGRSRRSGALPQAPAAASHDAVSVAEQKKAVDKALQHGAVWQKLVNGAMTKVSQRLRLAESGVKSAESGLAALEGLKGKIPNGQYQEAKGALHVRCVQSAEYGISTISDEVAQWSWTPGQGTQGSASRADEERLSKQEELNAMDQALEELGGFRDAVVKHGGALNEFILQCEQPGTHGNMLVHLSGVKSGAAMGRKTMLAIAGQVITVNVDRLVMHCCRSGGMLSLHLMPRVLGLLDAISKRSSATEQGIRILGEGGELSPEKRNEYQALTAAYADELNAVAELFCLDAASTLEMSDNSGIWQHSLELAHAISAYQACLRAICEPDGGAAPSAMPEVAPESSTSTSAAEGSNKATSSKARKSHGRGKQLQKQAAPRPSAPAASASPAKTDTTKADTVISAPPAEIHVQSPPSEPHEGLQGKIERTLKKYPIDLDVAKNLGGDVIAIARSIKKNTRGIEVLNGPKDDPIDVANLVRSSAQSWFGDLGRLRATHDEARKSPVINKTTVELLGSRLQALEIIDQGMSTREADALKGHKFPKGKHVSRLLQMGQIESVGQPLQLPSDKDTLYEIRIQPKPLSSGERAQPVFLHLHSDKYVSGAEVLKLPLRAFTAAHLKTNQQKNLGPKHEAMLRALHKYDTEIHRGSVTPALLDELRGRLHA